jgi:hypothetical protein
LNIYVEIYGFVARAHRIVLSLWSIPFAKLFTNGMSEGILSEGISSEATLPDVPPETFKVLLTFYMLAN